jgi:hypothetical protein
MGPRCCTRPPRERGDDGGVGRVTRDAHMNSHNIIMSQLYLFVKSIKFTQTLYIVHLH